MMDMNLTDREAYIKMLDELFSKLPKKIKAEKSRFKIPAPEIYFEGKRTIILNFKKIASSMNREPKILASYLAKELATPAVYEDPRLIIQTRADLDSLSSAINRFIKKYVFCPACGGPDTKLIKKRRFAVLKCEICGAETVVEPI